MKLDYFGLLCVLSWYNPLSARGESLFAIWREEWDRLVKRDMGHGHWTNNWKIFEQFNISWNVTILNYQGCGLIFFHKKLSIDKKIQNTYFLTIFSSLVSCSVLVSCYSKTEGVPESLRNKVGNFELSGKYSTLSYTFLNMKNEETYLQTKFISHYPSFLFPRKFG